MSGILWSQVLCFVKDGKLKGRCNKTRTYLLPDLKTLKKKKKIELAALKIQLTSCVSEEMNHITVEE